jgi:hypothetical protein
MRIQLPLVLLFAAVFTCSMHAAPAQAQRVFVSAMGSDGNPCSCRSFQHAHDVTSSGGEIDVLDPAGYGAVTITKAISVQGHGFSGITVASGAAGITINAGANDAVHLQGLLIDGAGAGTYGIVFNSGKKLAIENVIARNLLDGLHFISTAATTQTLAVSNSYFNDNSQSGIYIAAASSGAIM